MAQDKDYILGTHDDEIERLGLQHRVWRPRVLDAWRRAGFSIGQTLIDVGCGPGYATLDLAEIVGPTGQIIAVDRSARFLATLEATCRTRGLDNVRVHEQDLDKADLPEIDADGAWCRWVFAFVRDPRRLLERIRMRLRSGGKLVVHEYIDYSTWGTAPPCPEIKEFVEVVMKSWRADGGEPDIGLRLPSWLGELGFDLTEIRPILEIVPPSSYVWQWPKAFIDVGLRRLLDLNLMTPKHARDVREAFAKVEATPNALMITPAVVEIIAVRR
jgi:SAM-dependent methyltransferase